VLLPQAHSTYPFAMNWRFELIVVELTAMQHADLAAADPQPAAASPEVAPGLGRLSGLVPGSPPARADPVRQLCPGSHDDVGSTTR
jgi:hypothetical protein